MKNKKLVDVGHKLIDTLVEHKVSPKDAVSLLKYMISVMETASPEYEAKTESVH